MEWLEQGEIIIFTGLLLILGVFLLLFVLIFIRRKNNLLASQLQAKQVFEEALSQTRIELQEHTLRNISWELHDNIGQLLTLAKIQAQNAQDEPELLDQAVQSIGNALGELRALSKHINPSKLKSINLTQAIEQEIDRFNRLGVLSATLSISGNPMALSKEVELIIFRILQEFFTNTIKYAKADSLRVELNHLKNGIQINCMDNGIGFNLESKTKGAGLQNIKSRAQIINAHVEIASAPDKGTHLILIYNKQEL